MKVLLVEDNEDNFYIVKSNLKKVEGIELVWAKNGLEAKNLLDEGYMPDIILSDIGMPEMDGIALAKYIRSERKWDSIPLVAVTASVFEEMKAHYKEAGFTHILEKPFRKKELLAILKEQE